MVRTILIASSSVDKSFGPISDILTSRGYNVIVYEGDKVLFGMNDLDIDVHPDRGLHIQYRGESLVLSEVAAAWYRRPANTGSIRNTEDKARRLTIDRENTAAQAVIWSAVPNARWLNAPFAIISADQKIQQLAFAQAAGFNIPHTVVSNNWETILKKLPHGSVAFKGFKTVLYNARGEGRQLATSILHNDGRTPPIKGLPYPGIWQEAIPKKREWRITIVGDAAFDAAIYTKGKAKDDWRVYQAGPDVEFRRGEFPMAEKERCFRLLKHFGLRYGAFDFIERPDGTIVFLEMNPNGQYGWLEDILDLPISQAIADELVKIAKQ